MLNQFRATNIVWDKASLKLYAAIRASSSDENGRKLVVQVINKGVTENLENTSLSLYWEQGETKGLDSFNLIDAKNGIFEIYYTTEMLSHIGQLKAYLYLIDAVGAVTSEPFGLTVFKGIDTDAIQSDNSISTLTQAIIDVNNLKSDIAVIKSEEEERVSNENERKTAETARATAETTRNTNETTRVSNETNRVDAEDTRNTNETNRVDAESNRVTAETARVTAEEEREQGYPLLDGRLTTVETAVQNLNSVKTVTQKVNGNGTNDYISMQVLIPEGYKATPFSWSFQSAGSLTVYNILRTATTVSFHFGKLGGGVISASQFAEVTIDFFKK